MDGTHTLRVDRRKEGGWRGGRRESEGKKVKEEGLLLILSTENDCLTHIFTDENQILDILSPNKNNTKMLGRNYSGEDAWLR